MRESCTSGSERGKPHKGLIYLPKYSKLFFDSNGILRDKKPCGQTMRSFARGTKAVLLKKVDRESV